MSRPADLRAPTLVLPVPIVQTIAFENASIPDGDADEPPR